MSKKPAYYTTNDQDVIESVLGYRICDEYSVLLGPDGFSCVLTEPEDRIWRRDGQEVIDKLNKQHELITKMIALTE